MQLPLPGDRRSEASRYTLSERVVTHGDYRRRAGQAVPATVAREGGRWFCSFTCEVSRSDPAPLRAAATVGVDAGVRHLAVLSNGEKVDNPRALERARRKLRRLERRLDRQRRANNPDCYDKRGRAQQGRPPAKRSSRQRQTERKIERLHAHVRNVRRDALCKLTTYLASTYGTIVAEQLNAAALCRSGNRGLRRAVHDASLAQLRRQLAYKCAWRGGTLIEAPTFFPSSKRCSGCGAAKTKLPLSERRFRCESCGLVLDRDENAARNLAQLGSMVAASCAETENARSPTEVRPGLAGHPIDREAGSAPLAYKTGAADEESEAA